MKLSRIPYRQKITIVMLLFAILPFFLFSLFYFSINWNAKVEDIIAKYHNQISVGADNINNIYFTGSMQKMTYIINNYEINKFLEGNYDNDLLSMIDFYQNIKRVVFDAMVANQSDDLVSAITVFAFNPSIISGPYFKRFEDSEIYLNHEEDLKKQILDLTNPSIVWKIRTEKAANPGTDSSELKTYVCMYQRIMSLNKALGIVEIKIDFARMMRQFQFEIPEKSLIAYVSEDRTSIIPVNGNGLPQDQIENVANRYFAGETKGFYEISTRLKNNDLIYMLIPRSVILHELSGFILEAVVVFLAFIVAIVLTSEMISLRLTSRLTNLIHRVDRDFDKLENGDKLRISRNNDEFDIIDNKLLELTLKIKEYYQKMNEYQIENQTIELEKKALELDLLQARINPHFLYNTLSVIRYAFRDEKLEQVIHSLTHYYRIALNKGDHRITVAQEASMVEEYLKVQQFAYEFNFEYTISIDDRVKEKSILKHLLQPIVENAFVHGVCSLESGGRIRIAGTLSEGVIRFEVVDNGVGMELGIVNRILEGNHTSMYGGYGLKNVRNRIKAYYGEEYGIQISSRLNQGTVVTVTIPEREADRRQP